MVGVWQPTEDHTILYLKNVRKILRYKTTKTAKFEYKPFSYLWWELPGKIKRVRDKGKPGVWL